MHTVRTLCKRYTERDSQCELAMLLNAELTPSLCCKEHVSGIRPKVKGAIRKHSYAVHSRACSSNMCLRQAGDMREVLLHRLLSRRYNGIRLAYDSSWTKYLLSVHDVCILAILPGKQSLDTMFNSVNNIC